MTEEDAPTTAPVAGVKDGPTGQKTEQAPSDTDGEKASLDKASDVLHGGAGAGGKPRQAP